MVYITLVKISLQILFYCFILNIFFIEMNPIGKYINNKLSLCYKLSFAIIVLANSGLSAITNNTKKKKDIIKDIIAIIPDIFSKIHL